jgi:hypothetical protein
MTNMGALSLLCTTISHISKYFPVNSRPALLIKVLALRLHSRLSGINALDNGMDTMTLALPSQDINGAKYDSHVPLLSCEPCILAKLHHAVVIRQSCTKQIACFHASSYDIFGPPKETGPGGAKYVLGVIDNYIWLLALPNRKAVVSIPMFSRISRTCTLIFMMVVPFGRLSSSIQIPITFTLRAALWFPPWGTPPT